MVQAKIEYVVLEVTSQGAYQWRNWGLKAKVAALTNIDHDHWDYHLNFDNYFRAKALVLQQAQTVVINDSQPYFSTLKKLLPKTAAIVTYHNQTRFSANLEKAVRAKLAEDYNRLNAYLALTVAKQLGLTDKELIVGINNFSLPEGRMQILPHNLDFTVIVDFAHTPQGAQATLSNIRKNYLKHGKKLIGVAGCAGERDVAKRPIMGRILAKECDIAIFTAEDPRRENIWSIIHQMKSEASPYLRRIMAVPRRDKALAMAITQFGRDGNTIAILGKGHERSMNYDGKTETLWNDATAATKIIKRLEKQAAYVG
jgi:UDP-N-acetylmuramoyl-L-alanyl-D-glutamate--2,6-diaminopimelate ligase